MNLKERLEEQRQRKEAKAYFNQHNSYVLKPIDLIMIVLIALGFGVLGRLFYIGVQQVFYFSLGFVYVLIAYFIGIGTRRIVDKSGTKAAIAAIIGFLLGEVIATFLFSFITIGPTIVLSNLTTFSTIAFSSVLGTDIFSIVYGLLCVLAIYYVFKQ